MTTKHTPGPWKHVAQNEFTDDIVGPNGEAICGLHGVTGPSESNIPIVLANARLIAAAPELLAALKACIEIVRSSAERDHPMPGIAGKQWEAYYQARSAIALLDAGVPKP